MVALDWQPVDLELYTPWILVSWEDIRVLLLGICKQKITNIHTSLIYALNRRTSSDSI